MVATVKTTYFSRSSPYILILFLPDKPRPSLHLKEVMNMKNVTLGKHSNWYNPHFLPTDNGIKEVKELRLFDKDGVKHRFKWFVDNSGHSSINHEVTIDVEVKRKIKEDFSLNLAFYMSYKGNYDFEKGKVILYIPLSVLNIVEYDRNPIDYTTETYDLVIYEVKGLNAFFRTFFTQSENERKTEDNVRNEKILKLIADSRFKDMDYLIRNHFDDLKKLVNDIEEVKKHSYNINMNI